MSFGSRNGRGTGRVLHRSYRPLQAAEDLQVPAEPAESNYGKILKTEIRNFSRARQPPRREHKERTMTTIVAGVGMIPFAKPALQRPTTRWARRP